MRKSYDKLTTEYKSSVKGDPASLATTTKSIFNLIRHLQLVQNAAAQLISSNSRQAGPFQSPAPISGTVSLHISAQHRRSRFSRSILRLFSSGAPSVT